MKRSKERIERSVTLDLLTSVPEADSIITIQPGRQGGKDALVAFVDPYSNHITPNQSDNCDCTHIGVEYVILGQYTYLARSYIKFELPQIDDHSLIKAELRLYEDFTIGENEFYLNRVVSDWAENTITWNNQPAIADAVEGARSTAGYFETILDVTEMVEHWISTPQENFGMGLRLQYENSEGLEYVWGTPLKAVRWYSSDKSSGIWPKLVLYLKKDLTYFEVTTSPDTIDYYSAAVVHVQAKDSTGIEIALPDETLLDFELDANGQLYGNLVAPDSTQAKSLSGITYADVKADKVKYIANGQAPDSTTTILISVSQQDQPEVTGNG